MAGCLGGPLRCSVADEECVAGGFDDFWGDGLELVDVQDAFDLGEEAVDEAEVAAGDPGDGGDRDRAGELVAVGQSIGVPATGQDATPSSTAVWASPTNTASSPPKSSPPS